MKKNNALNYFSILLLICFASVWASQALAQSVTVPNPFIPPIPSQYVSPAAYHAYYGTVGFIDNGTHGDFLSNDPPPTQVGVPSVHSFGSNVQAVWHPSGGSPITVSAPCQATTSVSLVSQIGNTGTYQTEMLQLDIQGGTMPPGVRIRESPTLPSTGQTHITSIGGGQYQIDSFFDIFTELSVDGGASWIPSGGLGTNPSVHMQLLGTSPIPTLSQWGMILSGLLLLIAGSVFIMKRQIV